MDTRSKTNAEFRNDVSEMLAKHESNFDQLHAAMQTVLTELQAMRTSKNPGIPPQEINPFAQSEASNPNRELYQPPLKLTFPRFAGEDPTGWIYRAEQYFEFQNTPMEQRVTLASFHFEGIALQWHRWLTKMRGPLTWAELTKAALQRFGPTDYEDPSEALVV